MSILDRTFGAFGRMRGEYFRAFNNVVSTSGATPNANDPTVWMNDQVWGAGLLQSRRPRTKQDFIDAFVSWVYVCVKLNAQSVSSVPLRLFVSKQVKSKSLKWSGTNALVPVKSVSRQHKEYLHSKAGLQYALTKAEEIEEITEHPFLDLMKEVNPWNNRRDLWEMTTMFADLTGEAYWYMPDATETQAPSELFVIPSQFMAPVFGKSLADVIVAYKYKRGSVEIELPVEKVIQFPYPNPNNTFVGYSTVRGISTAVYLDSQMNEFEVATFENRARPGGLLLPQTNISRADRERLEQQFETKFKGARRAGRTLVMPKDVKYERDTMTNEELSFIEGKRVNTEIIAAAFDIPSGLLMTKDINRSNSEVSERRHMKHGILPRLNRIEEKINEKLMPLYDDKLFAAFDNPVPEDREAKRKDAIAFVDKIQTRNEIRALHGFEEIEGGDELFIDNRLLPLEMAGEQPVSAPVAPTEEEITSFTQKVVSKVKEIFGG